jgi:hypothetical protein
MFRKIVFMMLMCQPKLTIDVAPCFVLQANRSLIGILHNNGLLKEGTMFRTIVFMMLMCQPKLTIDVTPCFVLQAH